MWIYYPIPEGTSGGKSLWLGLCLDSHEAGGNFLGQEKARTGMSRVLGKQPLSLAEGVEKMPPEAGKMQGRVERQGLEGDGHRAGSQRLQGRLRREEELFALDLVPVFLLQRPRKTQQGVN